MAGTSEVYCGEEGTTEMGTQKCVCVFSLKHLMTPKLCINRAKLPETPKIEVSGRLKN